MRPIPAVSLPALGLLVALGSCRAASPTTYATLQTRASAPVTYHAELTSHAVRVGDLGAQWSSEMPVDASADGDAPVVDVRLRMISLPFDVAAGALGYRTHGKQAIVVDRAAAGRLIEQLVAEGRATELSAPRLATYAGQTGSLSITNQIAYIESFRVDATDDQLIADPNVGVAEDGMLLTVEPGFVGPDGDTIELMLELASVQLARPIESIEARIPGATMPVTLQTPLSMSQRLATLVRLAPDEAVVLGGLAGREADEFVFAIVTAERLVGEPATAAAK